MTEKMEDSERSRGDEEGSIEVRVRRESRGHCVLQTQTRVFRNPPSPLVVE